MEKTFYTLKERAKELECLYKVDEIIGDFSLTVEEMLMRIAKLIPQGFQNEQYCNARIEFDGLTYEPKPFDGAVKSLIEPIAIDGVTRGFIEVAYPEKIRFVNEPEELFLPQEKKLLHKISVQIRNVVYRDRAEQYQCVRSEWAIVLELLQKTDKEMLMHVCEKMMSHLAMKEKGKLASIFEELDWDIQKVTRESNSPLNPMKMVDVIKLSNRLFSIAMQSMSETEIFDSLQRWIHQAKAYNLIKVADRKDTSVDTLRDAIAEYLISVQGDNLIYPPTERWITVELIRRLLTNENRLIKNIRPYIGLEEIHQLLGSIICSPKSLGRIGGKGAGLFIASQIIAKESENYPELKNIKMPKTWYLAADEINNVLHYNNIEEMNEYKYREMFEVRLNYPKVIQTMKNAKFPSNIMQELSSLLDECGNEPIIVRSSSILEDQVGSAFSGKYKSLFLANQGEKSQRIEALSKAILEVYASMFNPDSIQYRVEHDLLDYKEQMGIIIQKVVGKRVGPYFFPAFAGVAFSNNELRWSPRIRQEDGLIRMVMGLGTRAVDRVSDDFPMLVSPGQPNLRVNQSPDEVRRYSQKRIDVINIETGFFETVRVENLLREYGNEFENIENLVSVDKQDFISPALRFDMSFKKDSFVVNFDGVLKKTPYLKQISRILEVLKEKLKMPVDIELAGDGEDLYILQCRPQSLSADSAPAPIPKDIPERDIIFNAKRYITNGRVGCISHIVYVSPEGYSGLERVEDLKEVGRVIGRLNLILPKKRFILMGPGRWGSRGDIKLGVPVTYSDINQTAMLIEIARKKSSYVPDLSFGTHFFQDLVEENIKYLPLYPDDEGVIFSERFFENSKNLLPELLPQNEALKDVVRVIDVSEATDGKVVNVLMNSDLETAIAFLADSCDFDLVNEGAIEWKTKEQGSNQYWRWRHYMAEKIASRMDMDALGVKAIYLFGSTNTCSAGPKSDIDLLIHFDGEDHQRVALNQWIDGWSASLSEYNYLRTGYATDGLLDAHIITDDDIAAKTSFAIKINSIYEPVLLLRKR